MRLLLTRAQPGASATAGRLRDLGHEVLVEPMLHIEFLPLPDATLDPAALIVSSANGARALELWPAADEWRARPVFAVGAATASACRDAGFTDVHSADGDAEDLFALVSRSFDRRAGQLLYLAAEQPASDRASELAEAGYDIRITVGYRAVPVGRLSPDARQAMAAGTFDTVLFYSERGAAAFVAAVLAEELTTSFHATDFLALSNRVAEPLRQLVPRSIKVAHHPDEDSLFALLAA